MNSIGSFSGLASGVQWADLIDQLMNLETARKLAPITNQVSAQQARREKWAAYETVLAKLDTANAALRSASAFGVLRTTTTSAADGKSLVSASASAGAAPGAYELEVISLARADKLSGSAAASTSDALGVAGEFYVNGRKVEIIATDSLASVRSKINAVNSGSDASGVTATILSTSSTEHRLVLTADNTGARGIELVDGDTGTLESLGILSSATAQNTAVGDSATAQSQRFSSTTTALASMLGVTAPPAVTTVVIDGHKISVDLQNDTLLSIMNRVAAAGGSASLSDEKVGGDTLHRLNVEGAVTADATATDPAASQRIVELLGFVKKEQASAITSGQDSVFRIDGFKMTRRTNTVSDAVSGLSLSLLAANGAQRAAAVTGAGLSISTDPHTIDAGTYDIAMTTSVVRSTDADPGLTVLAAPGTTSAGVYAVDITTAASVAGVSGVGFDGTYSKFLGSDTMTVTDSLGNAGSVTLTNNKTLASIVSDLNTSFTNNGAGLSASDDGGQLRIVATGAKGSSSTFTVASSAGNVATNLGIANGVYTGTDVAGTIGGLAATGSGEVLTGSAGAVNGLQVQYSGTATGVIGDVTVTDDTVVDGVTIGGVAATWDEATSTIRGVADSEFDGLVVAYAGAPATGTLGQLTVEDEDISVSVTVSRDHDAAISRMQSFVTAYNETVDFFNSQRGVSTAPLYANGSLRAMQRTLTTALLENVEGLPAGSSYSRGAVIGVALGSDGKLALDSAKLKTALQTNYNDVVSLFSAGGTATDGQVSYKSGTDATKAGTYAINITAAATRATQLGAAWGGNYVASNGVSDTLTITDAFTGNSVDFVALDGMTLAEAVTELTELFETEGMAMTAVVEGGALRLMATNYGTSPTFTLAGTDAANGLGLAEGVFAGTDIAGTIGGFAATGSGETLTGGTGEDTEGLAINYSGTATGALGSISYRLGVAGQVHRAVAPIIRSGDGSIANQISSIDSSIDRLNKRADDAEVRLELRRQVLEMQFIRMEQALSMLNSQGQWLTSQIQSLQPQTS